MRRTHLVAAIVAGALLTGPATAGAETLFDHVDETSPQSIVSQDFPASSDDLDALASDDFTVPAGETWQLDGALVRGIAIGPETTDQWNVTVFADAGGTPGATVFAGTLTVPGFPNPAIPLTSVPTLRAGTYWLAVQAILADGPGHGDAHRWLWAENDEQAGNRAAWRNPGGGHTFACPTFGIRSTCLASHPSPDQSFRLSGTRTVTPIPIEDDAACAAAKDKLAKAKAKLKKAKAGDNRAKVTKAKAKVKRAKSNVKEQCS